jgi:mannose-1-phosphate guanylyltransferase
MDKYVPKLSHLYSSIDYNRDNFLNKIDSIWNDMPRISIDYAVMEKSENIYCMKSEFGWSDLGTWVALHELLDKDADGNVLNGNILKHDIKNNLIFSDSNLVTVVGLDNVGVINYNGKILVIDLEKSEEVRYIFEQLDNKDK